MIKRMIGRNQKVVLRLFMGAQNKGMTTTRNVLAEIRGSEFPEQIIAFGGHFDSW
jgi:carboxypeptidase Q